MGQMPEFAQELIITYNKRVYVEFLPELSQLFLILRFLNHNAGYLYVLPLSHFSSNEIFSFSCTKQSQPSKKSLLPLV